jgi:hypothetical protein
MTTFSVATGAGAQAPRGVLDGTVDFGGAFLRQTGLADASVVTAAGQYRYSTLRSDFLMNAIGARTTDDRYTGQGVISAARFASLDRPWRWELAATGSAFGVSNAGPAFGWQGVARMHYRPPLGGFYLGGGGGQVFQGGGSNRLLTGHVGGYLRPTAFDRDELSAALAYTDVRTFAGIRRYVDGVGYWTHRSDRVELIAGGGARAVSGARLTISSSAAVSAAFWITDHAALVLAGGRALEDVARGVPSVRYLSASLRLGTRGGVSRLGLLVRHERPADDVGYIDVRVAGDSLRQLSVRLPAASTVELMADFTDWQPVALSRMPNGTWTLERAIARGTHRLALRIDGGGWTVPPNLPSVEDEFGGAVGLLIVP